MSDRSILGVASLIAGVTLLAKGVGFGRELVIAAYFGADVGKDAYTIAYILPAFSLVMLGGLTGPFHTTTQKMMAALRQREQHDAVRHHVASLLLGSALLLGLTSALVFGLAPWLVGLLAPQANAAVTALAVAQLRWMSPLILLGGVIGILCGISNDQNDYTIPSLSPLVASIAVIMVTLFLSPDPMALAWGTTLGAVGQFLIQVPAAIRFFGPHPVTIALRHPEVRHAWRLLGPAALGSTIGTLHVIIGTRFAAGLSSGSISVFDYANKLIQLPLGILMTALLIPLFPRLAQAATADDTDGLFHWLGRGIDTILIATVPLITLLAVLSQPIVQCVYQRGAFDAQATGQTAAVLSICACGIAPYALRDLLVRAFYALDDSRTPLWTSAASILVALGLMSLMTPVWGLPGIAIATVSVTTVNAVTLAILLKRRLPAWPLRPTRVTGVKVTVAGLIAAAGGQFVKNQLPANGHFWHQLAVVTTASAAIAVAYVSLLYLLRIQATTDLMPFRRLAPTFWRRRA